MRHDFILITSGKAVKKEVMTRTTGQHLSPLISTEIHWDSELNKTRIWPVLPFWMPEGFSSFQVLYSTFTLYLGVKTFSLAPLRDTTQQNSKLVPYCTTNSDKSLACVVFSLKGNLCLKAQTPSSDQIKRSMHLPPNNKMKKKHWKLIVFTFIVKLKTKKKNKLPKVWVRGPFCQTITATCGAAQGLWGQAKHSFHTGEP